MDGPELQKERVKVTSKTNTIKNLSTDECIHTRQGHYTQCFVDGHELLVTRVTHPLITFHKTIVTLPVLVRVGGVTHEPQQWAPGHKTIHALGLNDLSRMVTV